MTWRQKIFSFPPKNDQFPTEISTPAISTENIKDEKWRLYAIGSEAWPKKKKKLGEMKNEFFLAFLRRPTL